MHATLQRAAAAHGLRFGPDPSTHSRCTVGGMIGNNACGSRALGYGRTSDNVVSLDAAYAADGDVPGALGRRWWPATSRTCGRASAGSPGRSAATPRAPAARAPVRRPVPGRLGGHPRRWCSARPCGWCRTSRSASLVVLGYPSMPEAADAVPALLAAAVESGSGPSAGGARLVACEGLDARIVDLVRGRGGSVPEPAARLGMALRGGRRARRALARSVAGRRLGGAGPTGGVGSAAEAAALWRIREDGAGLAARSPEPAGVLRLGGRRRPARAARRLAARLRRAAARARARRRALRPLRRRLRARAHRLRPDGRRPPAGSATSSPRARSACATTAARCRVSTATGARARSCCRSMYDAESLRLFRAVKAICDPAGVLNPGVLVDPAPLDADLRAVRPRLPVRPLLRLAEDAGSLGDAVHRCTGVGRCVAAHHDRGDVPLLPRHPREKDSTRGRARVLQEALDGSLVAGLEDPAVSEALDLCLACKGCSSDCPTGVDLATYKAEVLHQQYARAAAGRASTTTLGGLPRWVALAAPVAPVLARAQRPATAGPGRGCARGRGPAPDAARDRASVAASLGRRARPDPGRVDLGGHLHRPLPPGLGPGGGPGPGGGRAERSGDRRRRLLRAHLADHGAARASPVDDGGGGPDAGAVPRERGAGRRAGAVLPGDAAQRRGPAGRRPARGGGSPGACSPSPSSSSGWRCRCRT